MVLVREELLLDEWKLIFFYNSFSCSCLIYKRFHMKMCFLHPCHDFMPWPHATRGQKLSIQFSSKLELLASNHGPKFWCIFKSQHHHHKPNRKNWNSVFFKMKKKKKKLEGREIAIFRKLLYPPRLLFFHALKHLRCLPALNIYM